MDEDIKKRLDNYVEQTKGDHISLDDFTSSVWGINGFLHKKLPGLKTGRDLHLVILDTLNGESPRYVISPKLYLTETDGDEELFQEFKQVLDNRKRSTPDLFKYPSREDEVENIENTLKSGFDRDVIKILPTKVVITEKSIYVFGADVKYRQGRAYYMDWSHAITVDFDDVVEVFCGSVSHRASGNETGRIQIITDKKNFLFEGSSSWNQYHIEDISRYVSTRSKLNMSYSINGRVNRELVSRDTHPRAAWDQSFPFQKGWGNKKRTWNDRQKESSSNSPEIDQKRESLEAHEEATKRSPPVEIGDQKKMGIIDFSTHHSGETRPVGEVQGFKIFVVNAPTELDIGDVVKIKIMSYNPGRTSAKAVCLES